MPTTTYPTFPNPTGPYQKSVEVTKSDATVLQPTKGLFITGTGNVVVTYVDGTDATWTGIADLTFLPIQVIKVKDATTATGIKALY